jgi:hypothetical protein
MLLGASAILICLVVIGNGRAPSTVSTLIGLGLMAAGFLVFVGSYLLLPLYVTTANRFDVCGPPKSASTWERALRLSSYGFAPIGNMLIRALLHFPPLAAIVGMGCSLAYRVRARRAFVVWSTRTHCCFL